MGIAEILAAKKAKLAGTETLVTDNSKATDVSVKEPTLSQELNDAAEQSRAQVYDVQTKEEPAVKPVEKPLTFAEKMALKKQQSISTNTEATTMTSVPAPSAPSDVVDTDKGKAVASVPVESAQSEASTLAPIHAKEDTGTALAVTDKEAALRTGMIDSSLDAHPPVLPETSSELAQAYADIKGKIEQLESLEDTALEGAMKELKKALMANPNAVSLMLDTDIGKMVIALRRITREAQVEAAKEKKPGAPKKQKNLILSQEDVEAVFNEL